MPARLASLLPAALAGLALTLPLAARAASALDAFAFDPARAPTGRVVHYVKSNLDGSRRAVLSVHFAAPLSIEVLKVEADGQFLALVSAELDPATLTESHMRSYNRLESGTPQLQMALAPDASGQALVASVAGTQMPVKPSHWPAHLYNFDFSGLNATLPYLKDPHGNFDVGVVDPDFDFLKSRFRPNAGVVEGGLVDKGRAHFRFERDEVLDDIPVHRYEVGGPAFQGIKGTLWINAKDGLIERFEHALPDNPEWHSFRLSRLASQPMTAAEWAAFKAAAVLRAQGMRDLE